MAWTLQVYAVATVCVPPLKPTAQTIGETSIVNQDIQEASITSLSLSFAL